VGKKFFLSQLNNAENELLHAHPADLPESLLHGMKADANTADENADAMTRAEVMQIAMRIGRILLKSGAETSRVEDTMKRYCRAHGAEDLNVFCTPTIIILGDEIMGGDTMVSRVLGRSTDLGLIMYVNEFSYNNVRWRFNYAQAQSWLDAKLTKARPYSQLFLCAASGIGSGCFSVMLGGNWHDFTAAFVTGFTAMFFLKRISPYVQAPFWENFVAGYAIGIVAQAACFIDHSCTAQAIIAGALMPFVPGLPFTNGLRDYIAGDLLSGNARIAEAILFALAIAFGLALALKTWIAFGVPV